MASISGPENGPADVAPMVAPTGLALLWYRLKTSLQTPRPYIMVGGIFLWLFVYWLLCEGLRLDRFDKIPGPVAVAKDLFSPTPFQESRSSPTTTTTTSW